MSDTNPAAGGPRLGGVTRSPGEAPPVLGPDFSPSSPSDKTPIGAFAFKLRAAKDDLTGIGVALAPLANIIALEEVETPLTIALLGRAGTGKTYALGRLLSALEALRELAERGVRAPFVKRFAIVRLEASRLVADPAAVTATAAYSALQGRSGGQSYAGFVEDAFHASDDPREAARDADGMRDELARKLDDEKARRAETEKRREKLAETLIYDTPGSKVAGYIRANRNAIESRLRGFGLLDGDAAANYRDLLRDYQNLNMSGRTAVALRSLFNRQTKLLIISSIVFLLGGMVHFAAQGEFTSLLGQMGTWTSPIPPWIAAHADVLHWVAYALMALGVLGWLVAFRRAVSFNGMLARGRRLLVRELGSRKRELDVEFARQNERTTKLTGELEVAEKRAGDLGRRAREHAKPTDAGGAKFLVAAHGPNDSGRAFLSEVGRSIVEGRSEGGPQRVILALDGLESLPPAEALRVVYAIRGLVGPGYLLVAAIDPEQIEAACGSAEDARTRIASAFDIAFDAEGISKRDAETFVDSVFDSARGTKKPPQAVLDLPRLREPLASTEMKLLSALASFAAKTPRQAQRFLWAYRAARGADVSKPALALMTAVGLAGDPEAIAKLKLALSADGQTFDPYSPPALAEAALKAAAANQGSISKAEAAVAWDAVRRYVLMPGL